MPRQSRVELSEETVKELENQFYTFLADLTPEQTRKFFAEFLTNEEKMMMYKRLALYWCLLEGYSLAKIQQMIGVTHDTTRIYNKKKNSLSDEFKSLVQSISKGAASEQMEKMAEATPATEEHAVEQPMAEELMAEEAHNEPAAEAEMVTEPAGEEAETHETAEDETTEQMVQGEETSETETKETEPKEEAYSGLMPDAGKEKETTNEDEPQEGKKKSGLAKFFGF